MHACTCPCCLLTPAALISYIPLAERRVYPVAGRLMLFWSALPDGEEDRRSLHSAEVVEEGEKWIATRWFKEV